MRQHFLPDGKEGFLNPSSVSQETKEKPLN